MSAIEQFSSNGQVIQYPNHDFLTAERITSVALLSAETAYSSEQLALKILRENKIYAIPGKFSGWNYTDIVAFGFVRIETKLSARIQSRGENAFQWRLKSRQTHKKGLRGEIVMLIADYEDRLETALFPVTHPVFYRQDGALKHGFTYRPDKKSNAREDRYGMTLNKDIWNAHRDNFDLVWRVFYDNVQKL